LRKIAGEFERQQELAQKRKDVFAGLTRWERTLLARAPGRPYTNDYIQLIFEDFFEIHGDRRFADDRAIVAGFGIFSGEPVCVIGHQKGRDTKSKLERNFGMPHPEGYRKALRVMKMAEKFGRPIFSFVDTPGAYPGIGAEERGQAEAIAHNLIEMGKLTVPVIVTVTGEGGSGGALAIAIGNRVNILENAIYSVISPEGCAAILWKDASHAPEAADAMKLTASDLLELKVVDRIIPEPPGGAHIDHTHMAGILSEALEEDLRELKQLSPEELIEDRFKKFRSMGVFVEEVMG